MKKILITAVIITVSLALLFGCALTSSANKTTSQILVGDADMSGDITITDITVIQRYLAKLISSDDISLTCADANEDHDVSIMDATIIQRYLAKYKDTFNVGEHIIPTIVPTADVEQNKEDSQMTKSVFYIKANGTTFTADFADNSSADAFFELLKNGDITINMSDYGNFEKVGALPATLPRNDTYITTEPGDVILYLGNNITVYYDTNSWNFTRLGKIKDATKDSLLSVFGTDDVTITFSLSN